MKEWEIAIPENGWIEVVRKVPLWEHVPPEFRVELDEARELTARRLPHYQDRELRRYDADGCECAVEWTPYAPGRLAPCAGRPAPGHRRCVRHGGPSTSKASETKAELARLRAENARLRAQLSEAEVAG